MYGKKLPGKPKLPKMSIYMIYIYIWLQDSELKVDSVPTACPADSRKTFCEVCNNAIIAKHCELKRNNWQQNAQVRLKNFLQCSPNATQSFKYKNQT